MKRGDINSNKSTILMELFADDLNNGRAFHDFLFYTALNRFDIPSQDIEDLIQDYYIGMSNSINNFNGRIDESTNLFRDEKLMPYLFGSFKNKTKKFLREKKKIVSTFFSCSENEEFDFFERGFEQKTFKSPYEACSGKEEIKRLKEIMPKLDKKYRDILKYCSEGMDLKDIKKQLHISFKTIRKRLNLIKERLKKGNGELCDVLPLSDCPFMINEKETLEYITKELDLFKEDEGLETVARGLDNLKLEHIDVLIQKYLENSSYKQIAEVQEIPMGTVKSRLSGAKRKLKKQLELLACYN